ncbi:MAG: type IV pilin, partial [Thermoplasmata archaeon]|nr:type IV pilin [Thermoplasmata archaeon]
MIGKIRGWIKDKAGVSPIIAIILMVAITVVLAATIYVWVSGMGGGGGGTNIALTLKQVSDESDLSAGYLNYTVQSVNGNPGWEDLKIVVGGTTVWDNTGAGSGITIKVYEGTSTVVDSSATPADLTGPINPGQKLVISGLSGVNVGDTV